MINQPPFALASTTFRFPALAALAGRSPLGGHREVAIAVYLSARLAHDMLPARGLSDDVRLERAAHARSWLSNLALPVAVRPAVLKLVDASAGDTTTAGQAVRDVMSVTANFLDSGARLELDQLAGSLGARGVGEQR